MKDGFFGGGKVKRKGGRNTTHQKEEAKGKKPQRRESHRGLTVPQKRKRETDR